MEETNVLHKKKVLAPKLRFREFNDSWRKGTIGDYYENLRTGMTPSRTKPDYFKGDIPWISSGELNYGYIETTTESITQEAVDNTNLKIYPPNTLFIAITGLEAPGTRGKCGMNNVPAATNQSCLAFEEIQSVSTLFLFQWYKKNGIWLYYNFAQGTKQQSFNNKLVKGFIFNIPSLPEQQKIASFLSAVDEKIQLLHRKKQLLEQYKKGVMQQLFSGKLRFKDENGKTYPKWEEKTLSKYILDYRLGGNYVNTEEITEYPLIKMGNLGRGNININKLEYIPVDALIDPKDEIKYGDLFFNTRNTLDLVGKVSIWRNELPKAYYNSNLMYLKFENNFFMNYYLNSYNAIKALKRFATGTTSVAAIYTKDLLKLELSVPCREEQKKIADFLSAIDVKIERLSKQITQTQNFKKGLLQQMFV